MTARLESGDPTRVGSYELLGRLGVGGMGVVYLGRSPGGRLVAVKVVRPELAADSGFRRRFVHEVAAARKVGGFYTAQVVDAAPDETPPWLATAYIPGLSLQQAIDDHGKLPAGSVAMLGAGLAEGLAAVHAQELVHRDLKPGNVILAEDGPRLIDFGIARALDTTSYTQTHTVIGTAAFMSPEQATGDIEIERASDLFSLGCVLAFAATGESPFGSGKPTAITYRIVHHEPKLETLSTASPELAALVRCCLAKDPNHRPALESVLDQLATLAKPGAYEQSSWLPHDVTQVINRRGAEARTSVMNDTPPPRSEESGQWRDGDAANQPPPRKSYRDRIGPWLTSRATAVKESLAGSLQPAGKGHPRRFYTSATISGVLFLLALVGWRSGVEPGTVPEFVDSLFELSPRAIVLAALSTASAVLNWRHIRRFLRPTNRPGNIMLALLAIAGTAAGFLTPYLAVEGTATLLAATNAPGSDDGIYPIAALTVILSLIVAIGLQRRGRWQAYASTIMAWTLLLPALEGLQVSLASGGSGVEDVLDALADQHDGIAALSFMALLGSCVAGAFLYEQKVRRFTVSVSRGLGSTVNTGLIVTAAIVGFATPFLAWYGIVSRSVGFIPALLGVGVLLALGIGWQLESDKS